MTTSTLLAAGASYRFPLFLLANAAFISFCLAKVIFSLIKDSIFPKPPPTKSQQLQRLYIQNIFPKRRNSFKTGISVRPPPFGGQPVNPVGRSKVRK